MRILGHDPDAILQRWQARAAALAEGTAPPVPDSTPAAEHARTPAADAIAALSARAGLFHFHFERRAHLPLPEAWLPPHRVDLAEPPGWDAGVLPERKYQSFRHDLNLASYHPHHRMKWGAHELCHGLVGFAWAPDATPFFHATAGRLAELLPVALWYFFDEAFLRRCPLHAGGRALFRTSCEACERAAAADPHHADARDAIVDGLHFVEAELAAIARSRREGRPVPHRWATIDLASDGVAYAHAHARRLDGPAFHAFAERFLVQDGGWSASLDALEARVLAVLGGMLGTTTPDAPPTPAHGRWRWLAQDVAWRLHHASVDASPGAAKHLLDAAEPLASLVRASRHAAADVDAQGPEALREVHEVLVEHGLDAEALLATGYPLPGITPTWTPLHEGLATCVPLTLEALGPRADAVVLAFSQSDGFERAPLGLRFARWLTAHHGSALADLARWEASVAALPPAPLHLGGPAADARRVLAPAARVLRFEHEVLGLAERVDAGGVQVPSQGPLRLVAVDGGLDPVPCPTALVLARDEADELLVLDVDPAAAAVLEGLGEGAVPDLPDDEQDALASFGVLRPASLAEHLEA